jgi:predicted RNase H-like HicB family nuclease
LKDPKYELNIRWRPDDRRYVVRVREMPGCMSHGRTVEEAVAMGYEAISGYVESLQARSLLVPR